MRSPADTSTMRSLLAACLPMMWVGTVALTTLGCRAQAPAMQTSAPPPKPPASSAPLATDSQSEWRVKIPSPAPETHWTYPAPSTFTLNNGLKVYVLPRSSGPVSLSLLVAHGASDVSPDKSGLASLAAKMMAEATKTKNHYELSEAAESLGSTLSGDANRDYIRITLDTLAADASRGIELLAETIAIPAFSRLDFTRLQRQHLDDLVAERQLPARLASLVGLRAVLGPDLGEPVGGRVSTVQRLTLDDVRDWYRTFAVPSSTALVVLGPVAPEVVRAAAQKSLGKLRGREPSAPALNAPPARAGLELIVVDRKGSVQSALFVAQRFPKRDEPGYAAREVLDNVIGGQFTSRVNQNLREQHAYTYGARSTAIATRHFGLFAISTSVETNVTSASIREILKELRELKAPQPARPITADEMLRARTGVIQNLGAHLEDGHRLLLDLEELFVYGLPAGYFNEYLDELRQLESEAVARQSEWLSPDRLAIVIVGDETQLRSQLSELGMPITTAPAEWFE